MNFMGFGTFSSVTNLTRGRAESPVRADGGDQAPQRCEFVSSREALPIRTPASGSPTHESHGRAARMNRDHLVETVPNAARM
jgi:hypothetical protein